MSANSAVKVVVWRAVVLERLLLLLRKLGKQLKEETWTL